MLLLDEPDGGALGSGDPTGPDRIQHARDHGLGVLYIDHNMGHVLPVADRILLLEHGRIERTLRPKRSRKEELKALSQAADEPF